MLLRPSGLRGHRRCRQLFKSFQWLTERLRTSHNGVGGRRKRLHNHFFGTNAVPFLFEDCAVDTDRREIRRGTGVVSPGPQVFDLLVYLIRNRDRVVSKDDLLEAIWQGRIVSEQTLASHINAVRKAIGDSGDEQRLIRTVPRKGFRFVGNVEEGRQAAASAVAAPSSATLIATELLALRDR